MKRKRPWEPDPKPAKKPPKALPDAWLKERRKINAKYQKWKILNEDEE
jgi:hypothetical protein